VKNGLLLSISLAVSLLAGESLVRIAGHGSAQPLHLLHPQRRLAAAAATGVRRGAAR
jgi:hypothetical protein